jgi:hypothetical protein
MRKQSACLGLDLQASTDRTQELLGWQPTHQALIEDVNDGHYFSGS